MRTIFTLAAVFISINLFANPEKVYNKLVEVNSYWKEQDDIATLNYPEYSEKTDREWIRTHLQLVEQVLRSRNTEHLNAEQKSNRLSALQYLNTYWNQGNFPINERYTYRTPIFIDDYDNFCAVGYLVKATGYEGVSRMIATDNNLGYVEEMQYPELLAWANEYGFTKEELAWIQPSYGPNAHAFPIGKGTDGTVNALYTDLLDYRLYVGGAFTDVNGNFRVNNIAYVLEQGDSYVWYKMGTGVNGVVNAITELRGDIFVAGHFDTAGGVPVNNVAYYSYKDTSWHNAGCLYGTVYDLYVYNGELYAAGDFDVCAALAEVNFAKWDTTFNSWQQMPGLDGHVNTIETINGVFYLGGRFAFQNDTVNVIKWTSTGGFSKFDNRVENAVTDFEIFDNSLYVATKQIDTNNTDTLLYRLDINTWKGVDHLDLIPPVQSANKRLGYNTLRAEPNILYTGGYFDHLIIGDPARYFRKVGLPGSYKNPSDIIVDGEVNDIEFYRGYVIAGGAFKSTVGGRTLNGICVRNNFNLSVKTVAGKEDLQFLIAPNPAHNIITIQNNFNATALQLYSIEGRLIKSYILDSNKQQITLPELVTGTYILQIADKEGRKATERLLVN